MKRQKVFFGSFVAFSIIAAMNMAQSYKIKREAKHIDSTRILEEKLHEEDSNFVEDENGNIKIDVDKVFIKKK